jgi:hypothetical protein
MSRKLEVRNLIVNHIEELKLAIIEDKERIETIISKMSSPIEDRIKFSLNANEIESLQKHIDFLQNSINNYQNQLDTVFSV